MIDIHSHILFEVDDGAQSLEESIQLLEQAESIGYTDIVCSSHYYSGRFENRNYEKNLRILREEIKKNNINVNIYSGNEFALKEGSFFDIDNAKRINNGTYLLVELRDVILYSICKAFFKELLDRGIIPIFAHVERYPHIKISELEELYNMGVVLQVNINSVLKPLPKIKYLLENRYIGVLATDTHRFGRRDYNLADKLKEIKLKLGEEYFQLLTEINPRKILNSEKIDIKNKGEKNEFEKINGSSGIFNSLWNKLWRRNIRTK